MTTEIRKPIAVSILSVLLFLFSPFIFFGSLFLWGEGFILRFPPGVDLSFPVADIVINTPATIIAAIGLWRMRKYGYVAAQLVAGIYLYGSAIIFVEVAQGDLPFSMEIMAPQPVAVLTALLLVFYLWPMKEHFR